MFRAAICSIVAAALIAGAFIASPELRAYALATIGSDDIINESILSEDIKNGQVKASDIATDAVGGSELIGVTKLLFGQCKSDSVKGTLDVPPDSEIGIRCDIAGVDDDDSAIASLNGGGNCFEVQQVVPQANKVNVVINNECQSTARLGVGVAFSIIVFDR